MSVRDARDKIAESKQKDLIKRLESRGFEVYTRNGYRGDYVKSKNPFDTLTVFKDKRIAASIRVNTGSMGWGRSFCGWQVYLPTYEPRGEYNQRNNRTAPADPDHWGFANMKSAGTVVEKVVLAVDSIPNTTAINIGYLTRSVISLSSEAKTIERTMQHALRRRDILEEVHAILSRDDISKELCSLSLQKAVCKLGKALNGATMNEEKRESLLDEIRKLEEEENK